MLAGYNVILLAESDHGLKADLHADGTYAYCGVSYVPVGECSIQSNPLGKFGWLAGVRQTSLLYLMKQPALPVAVILYEPILAVYLRFLWWCRSRGVALIVEVTEWNKRSVYGRKTGLWLLSELRVRVVPRKHDPVLVLSKYLGKYYARRGRQVFVMPPLIDTLDPCWMPKSRKEASSALRLMFCGTPIRDRQDIVLNAVLCVRRNGLKITIQYLGSTRGQLEAMLPDPSVLDALGDSVVFHGRVPYERVPALMGDADYAVLLREDARWSKACFPSKIPEFLSLGVPIICNITSDLGDYLQDGRNAFIVTELTVEAFADAIRRAAALAGDEAYERMRVQARQTASEAFDIRRVSTTLGDFIQRIVSG
jgi:glycosyltransferase involved in cell wall biosynthesis